MSGPKNGRNSIPKMGVEIAKETLPNFFGSFVKSLKQNGD
jgi:hypothetical protein